MCNGNCTCGQAKPVPLWERIYWRLDKIHRRLTGWGRGSTYFTHLGPPSMHEYSMKYTPAHDESHFGDEPFRVPGRREFRAGRWYLIVPSPFFRNPNRSSRATLKSPHSL